MSTAESTSTQSSESYEEIPYPGGAFRNTHPSHLAMVACLTGLEAPPPSHCRVLDLGCSLGSNLVPMAAELPDSEFVGIDFAANQIDGARKYADAAGVTNVRFEHKSILDIDKSFGQFDYIISHGVYSWVPRDVQEKILEIGRENLSPTGLCYVSYNTFPGWHVRGLVRDMMKYHTANFQRPREKIAQARGLLEFLRKHSLSGLKAYSAFLKEEAEMLMQADDSYLYHEHLEDINEPLYFHEFSARVESAGLRYMGDAAIGTMVPQLFDQQAAQMLQSVPILRREQYMDFLRNRMFRSSILCHHHREPNFDFGAANLEGLHAALVRPLERVRLDSDGVHWEALTGKLTTQGHVTKMIERLNEAFPSWTLVGDLLDSIDDTNQRRGLGHALLMAKVRGMAHLAVEPVAIENKIEERPIVPSYVRLQVMQGMKTTNLFHANCQLSPQQRFIVRHLDGTRTLSEVAALFHAEIESGTITVNRDDQAIKPSLDHMEAICREEVDKLRFIGLLSPSST